MAEKVKISPSRVKAQIENEGMTRPQLAQHYGISVGQINKFLRLTNMDKLRCTKIAFEIEEDMVESNIRGVSEINYPTQEHPSHITPTFIAERNNTIE